MDGDADGSTHGSAEAAVTNPTTSFHQHTPEWNAWRARALADLYFFADVILQYGNKVPMSYEEHALMCRFVERKTGNDLIDKAPYQLVLVPREVGKQELH